MRHRTSSLILLGLAFSLAGSGCQEESGAPLPGDAGCLAGTTSCGGVCVDLATSATDCGACGAACGAGQTCSGGACACASGTTLCGTACVNTAHDVANCGACGAVCPSGASCVLGSCACHDGLDQCGTACVNLQGDGANCGACGALCTAPAVCSAGVCSATGCTIAGQTQCGSSCVTLASDPANCGACGTRCATGQTCTNGTCGCPAPTTACGGACVDIAADNANCGACGVTCSGGQTCRAGACACATAGQTACSGVCTTLATDARNCGTCGNVCTGGQTCQNGTCLGGTGGGPGTGGGGSSSCTDVTFTISSTVSSTIASVATVSWSVNVPITAAHIDFGRTAGSWEYTAPVPSPSQSGNETLLLGMKPKTTYSYQVVVERSGGSCTSAVQTVTTGEKRNGLPTFSLETPNASAVSPGFTVACVFGMSMWGGGEGSWTFILDQDGEHVWWYQGSGGGDCVRATMSFDGQHMWMANGNVPGPSSGTLTRVKMDGSGEESFTVPNRHHDIAVLPDENVVTMEYKDGNGNGCDVIKELNPSTKASTLVYDVNQANPSFSGQCHSNAINWWPEQNLYTLSVMYWNSIIAFDRQGTLSWALGGSISDYSGATWNRQHQHHLLSASSLLLFNNDGVSGNGSSVLEYQMSGGSATRTWDFSSGASTQSMGDVKRLPNGNTLVTYSNQGVILEVNGSKQTVRKITAGGGTGLGYSQRRATLYGPPPPYQD